VSQFFLVGETPRAMDREQGSFLTHPTGGRRGIALTSTSYRNAEARAEVSVGGCDWARVGMYADFDLERSSVVPAPRTLRLVGKPTPHGVKGGEQE